MTAFVLAALVLVLIPGPNHVFIMTRSVSQGPRAGLVSALGVETGTLVHIALTVAGVASLIATSPVLFAALKYAGVGYLAYLGIRAFRRPAGPPASPSTSPSGAPAARSLWRTFREGALVNVLNPKVALFFLAFLPQFVTPGADVATAQLEMLLYGVVLLVIGLASDVAYALTGGAVAAWLRRRPAVMAGQNRVVGGVYLSLGAYAALA